MYSAREDEIHLGVFAYMGVEKTAAQYQPLVNYLNTKLSKRVVLDVLPMAQLDAKIANGEIDIATTNPTHFLVIRQKYALSGAIATLISASEDGKPLDKLGGVIIVKNDSKIKTMQDIKNASIATPSISHMGGYRAQAYELHLHDVDISPETNKIIQTSGSHQGVVNAVLDSKVDVGFIRDGILEDMIKHDELNAQEIRVINEQNISDYPYKISTQLYPEWPVFALPHSNQDDTKAVLAALLELQPTNKATLEKGIYGYTFPADYLSVEDLARHLRLSPFDKVQNVEFSDIWDKYKYFIILFAILFIAFIILYVRQLRTQLLLKSLLDNMENGVYGVDNNGICIWINEQALDMIGFSKNEVIGKDQHELFHFKKPDNKYYDPKDCPIYLTLLDGKKRSVKEHFVCKDGTFLPITLTVAPNDRNGAIVVFSDDTLLQESKEALANTNNLLTSLFNAIPDLFWLKDPNGAYLACNKRFEKLFGKQESEIVGKTDYDFVSKDLADSFKHHDDNAMHSNIPLSNFEEVTFASDGHVEYLSTTKTTVKDFNGNIIGIMGLGRDFTQIKDFQNTLASNKKRLSSIIESTNVGTWEWNVYTGEFRVNDRWAEIIGYTLEELEPISIETWKNFAHPDDLRDSQIALEKHFNKETAYYEFEFRMRHKNGEWIWVLNRGKLAPNSDPQNTFWMFGTHQDITDKKQGEIKLANMIQTMKIAADAAGFGVWDLDLTNNHLVWDDWMFKLYGISLNNFDSIYDDWVERIHPDDREYALLQVKLAIEDRKDYDCSFRIIKPDGSVHNIKANAIILRQNDSTPIRMVGVNYDITKHVAMTQQLELAITKAQEASVAKSNFLANMSHEIRTPMNAIIGLSDLMLDFTTEPKQLDYIRKINGSSKMLLGIINDILNYSKIEAGKLELEYKNFALDDILTQLRVLFVQQAVDRSLELYFHISSDAPSIIIGDELRLDQILTNFLSNALKFTHQGSVVFEILLKERFDNKAVLEFSITDNGIGMNPEELAKLFVPFSQADNSTERKYGGTGLGLSISKRLIDAMNGTLNVQSQKGIGSKFSFEITVDVVSWEQNITQSLKALRKVLVVDDQEISRIIVRELLEKTGCVVHETSNAIEALEMIKVADSANAQYDAVLMDWVMPQMDGKEAIHIIKQMAKEGTLRTEVPSILMISARSSQELEQEQVDIDAFLSKPITKNILFDTLANIKNGGQSANEPQNISTKANLSGITVLLTEDNILNQEVASMMLKRVGASVQIANNGKEAVDIYTQEPDKFDIILMDLQMPVMGGYEASELIRRRNKEIPIIALTAAAMIEDREKAMRSGMNDHLGKPIDMNSLYECIAKWTKASNNTPAVQQVSQTLALSDVAAPALDVNHLLNLFDNDIDTCKMLLGIFLAQLDSEFGNVASMLGENSKEAMTPLHTLKGATGNVGAKQLYNLIVSIEKKYKSGIVDLTNEAKELELALQNLKQEVESALKKL